MSLNSTMKRVAPLLIAIALVATGCKDKKAAPSATATTPTESVAKETEGANVASLQPLEVASAVANPHQTVATTPSAIATPGAVVGDDGDALVLKGVAFTIPEGWVQEKPSNAMRAAQFVLPGDAGSASLVITYFGADGAGLRSENIERWLGMVTVADDAAAGAEPQAKTETHNGLVHSVVVATGALAGASMRPGAPQGATKPNHTLYGVILEGGPEGPLYLKATGPAATIAAQTAALEAFRKSAKRAN